MRVGMARVGAYGRAFRAWYGIAPSEFRRNSRQRFRLTTLANAYNEATEAMLRSGAATREGGKVMNRTYGAILGRALAGLMFLPGFPGGAGRAQGQSLVQPVTIRSPSPLAEFAELIQGRYARPVTYEDALLVWRGDQDEVQATGAPRIKIRLFTLPEGLGPEETPQLAAAVRRGVDAYHEQNDGPRFDVRESRMGVHIVPARVAGMDGQLSPSVNLLDSVITVASARRTPTEHFMALCAALTASSGVAVHFNFYGGVRPLEILFLPNGKMPPQGVWTEADREPLAFEWGSPGMPAQEALMSLLGPSATTLSWELRCTAGVGRQGRKCMLSIVTIDVTQTLSNGSTSAGRPLLYDRCTVNCPKLVQPPPPLNKK